jgi:hypothetical protein
MNSSTLLPLTSETETIEIWSWIWDGVSPFKSCLKDYQNVSATKWIMAIWRSRTSCPKNNMLLYYYNIVEGPLGQSWFASSQRLLRSASPSTDRCLNASSLNTMVGLCWFQNYSTLLGSKHIRIERIFWIINHFLTWESCPKMWRGFWKPHHKIQGFEAFNQTQKVKLWFWFWLISSF